ncbi:MAG: hypothetical protein IJH67_07290 [Thermoguttaceae bacterium]|nr:hypothetical protein [Thermoguttaceae bacterium]
MEDAVTTIAAIDVGSNSIRMNVAQVESTGEFESIGQYNKSVRLGQDTFCSDRISNDSMRTSVAIFRDYKKILEKYKVQVVRCVATTAVREAINADVFQDRIYNACGIQVEILDPSEESHLILSAVINSLSDKSLLEKGRVLLVEVGGGNTLLTVLQNGKLVNAVSVNTGTVRLREQYQSVEMLPRQYLQRLEAHIDTVMFTSINALHLGSIDRIIAVSGGLIPITQLVVGGESAKSLKVLEAKSIEKFIEHFSDKSELELSRDYQIPFEEAQRIVPASTIFRYLLRQTDLKKMHLCSAKMIDGLVKNMALNIAGMEDESWSAGVIDSARALGEKFLVDLDYSSRLADCAVNLFDLFKDLSGLTPRHRLMLYAAGLLHEAGYFLAARAHHKHTYYLIANSDIFGLSRLDIDIVAQTARYYRKSPPKPTHEYYMALPREQRAIVSKLSAFLRVADAVMQGVGSDLSGIELIRDNDNLIVQCSSGVDPILMKKLLSVQGRLFEDLYGVSIVPEEK